MSTLISCIQYVFINSVCTIHNSDKEVYNCTDIKHILNYTQYILDIQCLKHVTTYFEKSAFWNVNIWMNKSGLTHCYCLCLEVSIF